jgi:hypothetical protein
MNSDIKEVACPACEYERNSKGRPIERDGQMECLECGASWREFDSEAIILKAKPFGQKAATSKTRTRHLADQVSFHVNEEPVSETPFLASSVQTVSSYTPGLGTMMACFSALLLFAGLYLGITFLQHGPSEVAQRADKLQIGEIKLEEQVRRNGEKVFTVKGLVSNPTGVAKPIPRIAIILRKQNGNEITRWYYKSTMPALNSGGKSRFATSIQYDTPIVAYAEAVFK